MKTCIVKGCDAWTGAFFLMCREHWADVPLKVKDMVNESYRTRQKDPERYMNAVDLALEYVKGRAG